MTPAVLILAAGSVLTVTADALSTGTVFQLPKSTAHRAAAQDLAVSTSLALGPFLQERSFEIVSLTGQLTASVAASDFLANALDVVATASADGALAIAPGTVKITKSASAAALTLAAPTAAQEGLTLAIVSTTAKAHTVTATGLIDDGVTGGSKDLATFAAFAGASLTLKAIGLKWSVLARNACTIS